MKDSLLLKKSFAFSVRMVKMYQHLSEKKKEFVLSKQCLRSGTAIGALIREAEYAQSTADYISKLSIALKEANETAYWLMLLNETKYIEESVYESVAADCNEMIRMLTAAVKTLKSKLNK